MADDKRSHHSVAIIGAGFGGLGMAMAMKRSWNYDDFIIFERGCEVGGTWRANTYPGAASDINIHVYTFSTDPRYDWPKTHGYQPEILDYLKDLADKYKLDPRIEFKTTVEKAEWDVVAQNWCIVTTHLESGKTTTHTATVLISATGILEQPHFAGIAGRDSFKGPLFHSARYRHDVSLRGKRVAVVGNGCSATQIVPVISEDPSTDVTSFCRTPMWYIDGSFKSYPASWKWVFRHVPMAYFLFRCALHIHYDSRFIVFRGSGRSWLHRLAQRYFASYIKAHAPREYHEKLIPDYAVGCTRIIRDPEYLSSLHRPNNRQNWDGIERITEDGIVTQKGGDHLPFDVIIFATGFVTDKFPIEIRGKSGLSISEYYDANGGPQGYYGATIPGFPNFMTIQGTCPNTTTGHESVIFTEECQFNYALQLFKPVIDKELETIEVTEEATVRFNNWIQQRMDTSIFVNCSSWYRVGQQGKVAAIWPSTIFQFWWNLLRVNWSDYETAGKYRSRWVFRRRLAVVARLLVTLVLVGVAGAEERDHRHPWGISGKNQPYGKYLS
ncbi:FAD/NAD-P-binding domain-containing protein [Vararia minispora EC-137]|uniref:FAD/NAD-P-binding domain-containing protein n=1 Tax=Vararia minispora EC-137 TaxID=1314806 RepID=A0ACB8QR86_9AGAM|nr:FAD/NAD-P-binding domain-containing protein [Vararia minispora EC-137]